MEDESEYVHREFWINPADVKRYKEAPARKGKTMDNHGSIIANKYGKPAIDRLHEDEKIPDKDGVLTKLPVLEGYHRDIGVRYKILCDCAEGRISAHDYDDPETRHISPALQKAAILLQVSLRDMHYVNRVLFDRVSENDYLWMAKCAGTLQTAFSALFEAYKIEHMLEAIRKMEKKDIDKERGIAKIIENLRATSAPKNTQPA